MILKSMDKDKRKLVMVFGVAESFDNHESDLSCRESLWDLYERWRSHHKVSHGLEEKQKRFNPLSEQELVDCDNDNNNEGCDGGLMEQAFELIKKIEWFMVVIYGYEMGPEKDEKALTKAVANQPVSILLLWMLVAKDFRFYLEGVFPGDCGSKLNHGVAVVGYGATLDGKELVG
ncbi:hypothetical protein V6N11_050173 [Hibiscus sabdariffa]|uniref:Peptidase C1A papain C-terminal domain-containing protein n=1 Tax=Hibiscus sabdariffa TaxID=183260 RepID=A0ABR2T9S0_9ROSI